jgi:tRNA/tmRNA/rRNA uracil-C5-methylase (TrmA/RlmC/RlmD family)
MDRNGKSQWDTGAIFNNRASISKGFTPICQCSATPRPGIVLDPFFGSGTVGQVAIKNKRDWLGVELNPEYIKLAKERIRRTQPALFVI